MNKIKGVKIGDQFIIPHRKRKDIYTVIDFYTITNAKNVIVGYKCIAQTICLEQKITIEIPFSTVVLNKLKK